MKGNNKKMWKTVAGVIAIVLILGILLITNAFVGNPLSAKLAERAIGKYIEKSYPDLDLEVNKPVYNFKDGSYGVKAKSRTSIDTYFYINYRGGEIYNDSYKSDVLELFNTIDRLSREYSNIAADIVANDLGYKESSTWVHYDECIYKKAGSILELDMKFDRELSIPAGVSIDIGMRAPTLDQAAIILSKVHAAFKKDKCYFEKYGLFLKDEKIIINISGVKPEDIESGNLTKLLKGALQREDDIEAEDGKDKDTEPEGISVYIMEKRD